jgi:hypothetical protein
VLQRAGLEETARNGDKQGEIQDGENRVTENMNKKIKNCQSHSKREQLKHLLGISSSSSRCCRMIGRADESFQGFAHKLPTKTVPTAMNQRPTKASTLRAGEKMEAVTLLLELRLLINWGTQEIRETEKERE